MLTPSVASRPARFVQLPARPLSSGRFDAVMIYAIPALAAVVTAWALVMPEWLPVIILADLWLLGYHHVIATYTRTSFDRASFRRHWKLNVLLPIAVLAVTLGIAQSGGAIALTTIYIHWQLFHYVRQSEGVSKAFASRQGDRSFPMRPAFRAAFYGVPLVSFLTMAATAPQTFLGFPVWVPVLPMQVLAAAWVAMLVVCALAARELVRAMRAGDISREYAHFILTHFLVFGVAYAGLRDITLSWLLANVWHNAQYLAFVWHSHQSRFRGQAHPDAPILSALASPKNLWMYGAACLALTGLVYYFAVNGGERALMTWTSLEPIAIAAVIYQTINFHHYIVDAIIWRRPKPAAAQPVPA